MKVIDAESPIVILGDKRNTTLTVYRVLGKCLGFKKMRVQSPFCCAQFKHYFVVYSLPPPPPTKIQSASGIDYEIHGIAM